MPGSGSQETGHVRRRPLSGGRALCGLLLLAGTLACSRTADREPSEAGLSATAAPVDSECVLPAEPTILSEENGAILQTWTFGWREIFDRPVLPADSALLEYRAAIEADGADLRRPVADQPVVHNEEEAAIRHAEEFNNELAFSGQVGRIEPITCLDALLFAHQANRVSELDHPTEFVASVLRRSSGADTSVVIVFGAGLEMFPPKSVYGFDVAEKYVEEGWTYRYALHNHTVQKNGPRLAPGTPAPSASDVHLMRNLARELGLQSVRVTNGFYTFSAAVAELDGFRTN